MTNATEMEIKVTFVMKMVSVLQKGSILHEYVLGQVNNSC